MWSLFHRCCPIPTPPTDIPPVPATIPLVTNEMKEVIRIIRDKESCSALLHDLVQQSDHGMYQLVHFCLEIDNYYNITLSDQRREVWDLIRCVYLSPGAPAEIPRRAYFSSMSVSLRGMQVEAIRMLSEDEHVKQYLL